MAFKAWAVPCPWDLCAETVCSQTLSSLPGSSREKFQAGRYSAKWGAENGRQTWR